MKNFLISAAMAVVLTVASSTVKVAISKDLRSLADAKPLPFKCAVYVGELTSIRQHAPASAAGRQCESYWADDTSEDERENGLGRRVASTSSPASTSAQR